MRNWKVAYDESLKHLKMVGAELATVEAENAERVQKKRKRFLEQLKESGAKHYNISPMPGATEEQLLDDAISCISALPQITRNVELERDVERLRAYAQRDIDCEYNKCPVEDCVDCRYFNTLKSARKALASTQKETA
jgi:hypothetical protein